MRTNSSILNHWLPRLALLASTAILTAGCLHQSFGKVARGAAPSAPDCENGITGQDGSQESAGADDSKTHPGDQEPKGLVYNVVKNEYPAKKDGLRFTSYSLRLEKPETTIELEDFVQVPEGSSDFDYGFNESSLTLEWITQDRLLHVSWCTVPVYHGQNIMATELLLAKTSSSWVVLYRDRHQFHWRSGARDGWYLTYAFATDHRRLHYELGLDHVTLPSMSPHMPSGLVMEEVDNSYRSFGFETDAPLAIREKYFQNVVLITDWPCRIRGQKLEFGVGTRKIAFEKNPAMLEEVVRYMTDERNEPCDIATLRKLNPRLRHSDTCSGLVILDTRVPSFKPGKFSAEFGE